MFLDAPSGDVYIPPDGYTAKRLMCVTNEKANITWVYADGEELNSVTYGIIRVNDTASAMSISHQLVNTLPGKVTGEQIYCQAGNMQSTKFLLHRGGK